MLEGKDEHVNDFLLWTPTHEHASIGQPGKTDIYQLCANTGYCLEDLLRGIYTVRYESDAGQVQILVLRIKKEFALNKSE